MHTPPYKRMYRNLEKLALVRKRREEAKTKREAEGRAPGADAVPVKEDSSDSDSSDSDSDDEARMQEKKAKVAQKLAASKKSEASKKKKEKAMAKEAEDTTGSDLPVLKSIDIKKMNPAAIKDALKERGESTQGQKKDLIKRLTDFEAARA